LLEAIGRFVEAKGKINRSRLFESFVLFDIEFEVAVAVQESCFSVDLDDE
jgi:hypothetical protein